MVRVPGWRFWLAIAIVLTAALFGLSAYGQRARFCGSCHAVGGEHFESWRASVHGESAECSDCHSDPEWTAHYHSRVEGVGSALRFYLDIERTPAETLPRETTCLRGGCHVEADLVGSAAWGRAAHLEHLERVSCIDCHGDVGHSGTARAQTVSCADCHGDDEMPE